MNQKAYSILFSALLASTFVHEIRAKAAANPSFAAHVLERVVDPPLTCEVICNYTSTTNVSSGLSILTNANATLLVVVNVTAQAAFIIDFSAGLFVLLNGNTGAAVVFNLETNSGVYISSGVWVHSKTTIEVFVASLTGGLSALLKISGAVTFKVSSASETILAVVNGIVGSLILNIKGELQGDAKLGLQIIIAFASQIRILLRGSLKGLLTLIGTAVIAIRVDLAQFWNILLALGTIFSKISGGLAGAISLGVVFSLKTIFNASSGLEVLVSLILAFGEKIELGKIWGSILNDTESFLKLIAQLGGNVNAGLTGIFKVVASIVAYINGNLSIYVLINIIIQYVSYNGHTGENLSGIFNSTLSVTLEAVERVGATNALSGFVTIIKALLNRTLIYKGVSISAIIEVLLTGIVKGVSYSLRTIVGVLLLLKTFVAVSVSIPALLLVLILNINTAIGIQILRGLGIAIDISTGVSGGIIAYLLKSATSVIRSILTGNLYSALLSIQIFGTIVKALAAAVSAASGGTISLEALFNGSVLIQSLFKGFFQFLTGIYLGASASIIAQIQSIFHSCTSVSAYYSFSVTTDVSVSS